MTPTHRLTIGSGLVHRSELPAVLGVNRQRADQLRVRDDFPAPAIVTVGGQEIPLWRRDVLDDYNAGRRVGRPPKDA